MRHLSAGRTSAVSMGSDDFRRLQARPDRTDLDAVMQPFTVRSHTRHTLKPKEDGMHNGVRGDAPSTRSFDRRGFLTAAGVAAAATGLEGILGSRRAPAFAQG